LNELLATLHVDAIRAVARPGDRVLVDQFSKRDLIGPELADLGVAFEQHPRAESDPAVAAASVIARSEFLIALRELSQEWTIDLHKGAGEPVDLAAVEFARLHGEAALGAVAKLHFKNSAKVRARLGGRR
jgi:ribonuclease HIII